MGRMDDAVKAFHKVIEMKEDHISAWSNLALLLENTGLWASMILSIPVHLVGC